MKQLYRLAVVAGMLMTGAAHVYAQNPLSLGNGKKFVNGIKASAAPAANAKSAGVQLQVGNGQSLSAQLNVQLEEGSTTKLIGQISGSPGSTFFIEEKDGEILGRIVLRKEKKAYVYYSQNGVAYVKKTPIDKVECVEYDVAPFAPIDGPEQAPPPGDPIYNLQSFPGAQAVVKLDFDGEVVTNPYWNGGATINAAPATHTAAEIQQIFNMISEDFRPWNVNITTNEAVFNAAPANRRMRCIFTPTNTAAPGAGGVAYVGSFTWGNNTPCWVFNGGIKGGGEAGSHEIGHTMGLSHDGRTTPAEAYFQGHGDWAPIMGVGYYRNIVQWSKGEYANANQLQDDLNIISTTNGFTYRTDDHGNTTGAATILTPSGTGAFSSSGIITTRTDLDVFRVTSGSAGTFAVTVSPAPSHPDLNVSIRLLNSVGGVVATSSPAGIGAASISASVGAGTYYVEVDGVGEGNPLTDGYTDYASLGAFTITGTVAVANCVSSYEPNETIATATTFGLPAILNASIGTTTDQDYYKITVTQNGNLTVLLSNLVRDYDLKLYNSAGTLVASSGVGGTTNETVTYFATPGVYYAHVFGWAGAFGPECYRLTSSFVNPCLSAYEPNETIAAAAAFTLNSSLNAAITTTTDNDYFRISVSAAGTLTVRLSNLVRDYDLYLYNSAGTLVASSAAGGAVTETVTYSAAAGLYYARVFGYAGANGPECYLLTNSIVFPCTNVYEPNETFATAYPWLLNSSFSAGISPTGDNDYFKVSVPGPGLYVDSLYNLPADYDLRLYNPAGVQVGYSGVGGTTNERIQYNVAEAGTYVTQIYGYAGANSPFCYSIRNRFVANACVEVGEPNESIAAATYLPTNTGILARITTSTDNDYFRIITSSGSTNIQVKLTNLVVDFDVYLYSKTGAYLAGSALGGAASETINYASSTADTFYVYVRGWSGATSTQCYALKVNTSSSPFIRSINDDDLALSDKTAEGYSLNYYPNPAITGQELAVELTVPEGGAFSSIKILDMNGIVVSEQEIENSNGQNTISLAGIQPGVYILDAGKAGKKKLVVQ